MRILPFVAATTCILLPGAEAGIRSRGARRVGRADAGRRSLLDPPPLPPLPPGPQGPPGPPGPPGGPIAAEPEADPAAGSEPAAEPAPGSEPAAEPVDGDAGDAGATVAAAPVAPTAEAPAGLVCSLGSAGNGTTAAEGNTFVSHAIDFYYALGTSGDAPLDVAQTFQLQQRLFDAIEGSIAWCYEPAANGTATDADAGATTGRRRALGRRLEIQSVSVGPTATNVGTCPSSEAINELTKETGAASCQVNRGSIRVMTDAGDNIDYMSSILLEALQTALNDDKIWEDSKGDLAEVAFLSYLGTSMDEVYGGAAMEPAGSDSSATAVPPGVVCALGRRGSRPQGRTFVSHAVGFYYALGTTDAPLDAAELFRVQQRLFQAVESSIAWCYDPQDGTESGATESRRLSSQVALSRRLEIQSVSVGPTAANIGDCPNNDAINEMMKETGAASCQVNEGVIRVMTNSGDNIDYMASVLLEAMQTALNDNKVWMGWKEETKGIAFLSYVGASADEVYGNGGASAMAVALGVGIPLVVGLLLLGFVRNSKDRKQMTEREYQEMMNSDYVMSGTSDPPGSFHEGLYHYMRNGTRYLSTNCEGCLETRRNSFFTDDHLGTILEDSEFEENILVTANSKNLGARASNMDVHKCTSATCERCLSASARGTRFIPASIEARNEVIFSEV